MRIMCVRVYRDLYTCAYPDAYPDAYLGAYLDAVPAEKRFQASLHFPLNSPSGEKHYGESHYLLSFE